MAEKKPEEKKEMKKEEKKAAHPSKKEEAKKPEEKKVAHVPKKEEKKPEARKEGHVHEAKKAEHAQKKEEAHAKAGEKKKIPKRKKTKVALASGKRKEAIARAVVSRGKGRMMMNRVPLNSIPNRFIREIVTEPLNFVGQELHSLDINVYVRGGGQMGQAQAARSAIAKALVEYLGDEDLKNAYLGYDRSLLVDDVRRVEPKKYKGPKARARFQKSYR